MQKPASTPLPVSSRSDEFLRTVLRSGLIDRATLRAALRPVPLEQRGEPEALADHLVKAGKLSRFQARKLLKGTALGLVLGHFQILAPIARGGMGTVFLARDSRSNQLLALKILPPGKAREEPRMLTRFQREMEMCQKVAHPHLAWTCEVGLFQGIYYIAMEYIPGKSLFRLVAEEGPLAVPRAARLFAEVSAALDHTHQQGLIHRDIKPSNVLVTPNDHAKLLDLGLALVQGEQGGKREVIGGEGYVVGTMDYLAPEQGENAALVDFRCDLYGLGCTLYYALTGRPPFPGGTNREKIIRQQTAEPEPVLHHNPGVPPDFVGLVRRLMAKNPEARPASAAAIREELLTWVGDGPVLPMDRPEDGSFQQEVLRLEAAEPSPEPLEEVSSVAEALPAVDEPVMDLGLTPPPGSLMRVVPRAPRKDTEPETDNDRQRLILGAIAGGLTFTIGAAILTALVLFLRH